MANSVDILEREVLSELLPYLTDELQKAAKKSGWPSDVIASLSVGTENGDLAIEFPESLESKIQTLEYGTGSMPPRSVLRPFISRFNSDVTKKLSETTLNMFMDGEL